MEVPIVGSDVVQWIQVTVPTASRPRHPCAPLPRDAAGCFAVGEPSNYVIWRVHKDSPTVLELMEWSFKREPPKFGLHVIFHDSLCPFACIFKHQMKNIAGHMYLLYVLTTSGFAYLIKLKSPTAYQTGFVLPNTDFIQLDISKNLVRLEKIATVAAAAGILCVGGQNGSILCYQLGQLDDSAQDFSFELKDGDVGLGRLWGLVARGKSAGAIRSLVASEADGKKLLFALHDDCSLRIWDLVDRCRVLNHSLLSPELTDFGPKMLCVGEMDVDATYISVAVLYRSLSDVNLDTIVLCSFDLGASEVGVRSSSYVLQQKIPLEQGNVIDMKLSSNRLWVLKEVDSALYDLFHVDLES